MNAFDYIIVGSGAGGGTLAATLAPTGKRILVLERGDYLPREEQNDSALEVFQRGRYVSPDTWLDPRGRPFQPQVHYNVGGATKLYGAALLRLHPLDYYGWPRPFDAEMMDPWYSAAERMYKVTHVPHEPFIQDLSDRLERAGYHPEHAPSGVLTAGPCTLCNVCDGFPCKVLGKSDAEVMAIQPALRHPNVSLWTNARVYNLTGNGDRVNGVVAVVDGRERTIYGDTIVLSAGAVNSAAILMRSGVQNDNIGRNYMCHRSRVAMAITPEVNPTQFQKTLMVNDFYDTEGSVQMVGRSSPAMYRANHPRLTSLLPGWTLQKIADHAIEFWLMTEDRPKKGNRVILAPEAPQLFYDAGQAARVNMSLLTASVKRMMHRAGYRAIWLTQDMPLAAVAHQAGTCRMGTDPATSVVDTDCRVHGYDNLFVVDASFMPSVGAVNPALTIMANAIRVGVGLIQKQHEKESR